jgi:hypothetical protein
MAAVATEKQKALIAGMAEERQLADGVQARLDKALETMTVAVASKTIAWLKKQPRKAKSKQAELEVGVPFEVPNVGILIVRNRKDGNGQYALKLVESAKRLNENETRVDFDYEYPGPGLIRMIRPEHRLTLERAKELTIRYSRCIACGAKLKAAQSVEDGIGPVCRSKFRKEA